MKIGIDARMYRSSAAGIGRYSQNLIKNLLEIDHDDEFVLFMTDEDAAEFKMQISNLKMTNQNVKIILTNIPHYSLSEQTKLPKIIEAEKLDLMHFLNFNHPVRYKGKFIVTIHDLTLLFYPEAAKKTGLIKKSAFKYAFGKACRNADRIIAVSENTKNDIVKTFHIASEKIAVVYEAVDDRIIGDDRSTIEDIRHKYDIQEPVILYVGQFRQHKNIKRLIEAFSILKKDIPAKLVLVGKVPEGFIDNEEILRDTLMPGFVSDEELAAWYKAARVFVFPSLYEGFGLPGLEAMAAGLPVVASNASSLPEIYGDAALYFDPSQRQEIADKIKMVLEDTRLRNRLIEQGKIVSGKYSWKKAAEKTLKIYQEIQRSKLK